MNRIAGRRQGAADVQEVVAQTREARANPLRVPVLDVVLELVDLDVHIVDEIEEAFGDVVGEMVGDHRDVFRVAAGFLCRRRVPGRASVRGRLPHGDEHVARHDEVDLLVEDDVFLGDHHRGEEDPEHVVAVRLELGPGFVLVQGGGEELVDRAVVDLAGKLRRELFGRRVEQVDPTG
jgi:hypothetical protein